MSDLALAPQIVLQPLDAPRMHLCPHPTKAHSERMSFYLGSGTQTPIPSTKNLSVTLPSVKELENFHKKSSYGL